MSFNYSSINIINKIHQPSKTLIKQLYTCTQSELDIVEACFNNNNEGCLFKLTFLFFELISQLKTKGFSFVIIQKMVHTSASTSKKLKISMPPPGGKNLLAFFPKQSGTKLRDEPVKFAKGGTTDGTTEGTIKHETVAESSVIKRTNEKVIARPTQSKKLTLPRYTMTCESKLDFCSADGYLSLPQQYQYSHKSNDQVECAEGNDFSWEILSSVEDILCHALYPITEDASTTH